MGECTRSREHRHKGARYGFDIAPDMDAKTFNSISKPSTSYKTIATPEQAEPEIHSTQTPEKGKTTQVSFMADHIPISRIRVPPYTRAVLRQQARKSVSDTTNRCLQDIEQMLETTNSWVRAEMVENEAREERCVNALRRVTEQIAKLKCDQEEIALKYLRSVHTGTQTDESSFDKRDEAKSSSDEIEHKTP